MWRFLLQLAGRDPAPPVDNPVSTGLDLWKTIFADEMGPLAVALVGFAILSVFELFWHAEKGHSARGRLRNFAYLTFFKVLGVGGVTFWFAYGPRLEIVRHQSSGLDWVGYVALNLIAIDLLYYAYHQAQHAFPALWALHELHHADTELNATTSFRTFWLELPVQFLLITLPTILLFGTRGPEHALAVAVFSYGFLVFTHCNLRLPLGPFSLWLCRPQVHRVHQLRTSIAYIIASSRASRSELRAVLSGDRLDPGNRSCPGKGRFSAHRDGDARDRRADPTYRALATV